jgi:hypothetical protein
MAALADPTVRRVELPPGRFRVPSDDQAIVLKRSTLRILAHDTTLVPDGCVCPLWIMSDTLPRPSGGGMREYHATGQITQATDTLTLAEAADLQAGDVVIVKCGVSTVDPAECVFQCYRTIASVTGSTVKFTEPFSRDIPVHADYSFAPAGLEFKTGAWADTGGAYNRGLGLDHGIMAFANRKPVSNITCEGLTIEWQDSPDVYGSGSLTNVFVRNVRYRDIKIINPHDKCVHFSTSDSSGVEGLTVTGKGDGRTYQGGAQSPASAFSLWGGDGCYARDVNVTSTNTILTDCQVGTVGTLIERAYVRTSQMSGGQQLSIDGSHYGLKVRDVRFDVPQASSGIFNSYGGFECENIAFENGILPDWLHFNRAKITGTVRIGNRVFGPMRYVRQTTNITSDGQILGHPQGLYASAKAVVSSRAGIRGLTEPNDVFALSQPGDFEFPFLDGWKAVSIGSLDQYLADRSGVRVWTDGSVPSIPVVFEGYALLEQ